MICVENEAKWFNMQWCFQSYDEWLRYQISVKENKLKNIVQINTENTTLGCTKNGSERFSDENFTPQRTVQNGSVSGTVQSYLRFLVLSTKNGSERFPGRCLGAVFWHMFFQYQNLSWKRGLKALKLLMKGKGSFYI